ncbi:hypothetical protein EIP86_008580 [Pleurotus ostreatoroseus]|nr:hypothetical protein EIP86_008580 [Pleurotus ostreatoroseus]
MPVQRITAADAALLCVFVYLLYSLVRRVASARKAGSRPPGPPGIWFFGNAYQIPSDRQWLQFDQWTRTYGWDRGLGYSRGPKDARFREFRRLFHKFIGPQRVQEATLLATQERYAAKLLLRLLREPDAYLTHIRQSTGALLLHVAYGYDVKQEKKEDEFVRIAEVAMQGFSLVSKPGAFLVDTLPWLKYVPAWVPGARFQRVARRMWEERERLYNVPFGFVKEQMKNNQAMSSFVKSYMEEKGTPTDSDEEIIKAAAASLYSDIQEHAQAEIDSVLGRGWQRLPTFDDRQKLPYVNAIVLELLRWNPAVPLGTCV